MSYYYIETFSFTPQAEVCMIEESLTLTEEQVECLRGCSQYPQYYHGRRAFETGYCPFCTPDTSVNTILYNKCGWLAWEVPQHFTTRTSTLELQLVFFPKRHIRRPSELSEEERLGYFEVFDWAERTYHMPGGGIVNRFGDMRKNVGTIMHMHASILVPNGKGEVIVPLQKSRELWLEHDARMRSFAQRYEAGEIPAS
jgi:hypothetical protein